MVLFTPYSSFMYLSSVILLPDAFVQCGDQALSFGARLPQFLT